MCTQLTSLLSVNYVCSFSPLLAGKCLNYFSAYATVGELRNNSENNCSFKNPSVKCDSETRKCYSIPWWSIAAGPGKSRYSVIARKNLFHARTNVHMLSLLIVGCVLWESVTLPRGMRSGIVKIFFRVLIAFVSICFLAKHVSVKYIIVAFSDRKSHTSLIWLPSATSVTIDFPVSDWSRDDYRTETSHSWKTRSCIRLDFRGG